MDFSAIRAVDNVPIGNHAVFVDKETAAARKLLALRIEGFNCDGGGFDAANQIGKLVLGASL